MIKKLLLSFCLFTIYYISFSQNLDQISLKKGFKVSGSLNLSGVAYTAHGINSRRDPFTYFASGNLNLNLFGYSAPFTFTYSNGNSRFSQPFNQFVFAPQYKWVKVYLGYSSLTFSPYTLAGHVFSGIGVELSPKKWKLAIMYGRLRKAVPFSTDSTNHYNQDNAAFKRIGYGIKVGYEEEKYGLTFSSFTAKDDINSIPFILYNSTLTPQQNVAISLSGRVLIAKHISLEGEYAISVLNKDTRNNVEDSSVSINYNHNFINGLLPQNSTKRYFDAIRSSIGYQVNLFNVQFKYERIAPEYQTLGAYYFNNDMENITIAPSFQLFKNKFNISANAGIQQNNLDQSRISTTKRWIGALNLALNPNEKWNFNLSYSNFSSFTNTKPITDPFKQRTALDTLNYYQLTGSANGTASYSFGNKEIRRVLIFNGMCQTMTDYGSGIGGNSNFFSGVFSYSHILSPKSLTLTASMNFNKNNGYGSTTTYYGPTLGISKLLFEKKFRTAFASSYNSSKSISELVNSSSISEILNNRLTLAFNPKSTQNSSDKTFNIRHIFSASLNLLQKLKGTSTQPAYMEFTTNFSYTLGF